MITVALCDDEEMQLKANENMLKEYGVAHPDINLIIKSFRSGATLLEHIRVHNTFDLYLLDVIMPDENGISLGHKIRKFDKGGAIFYLTSSLDYAIDAFDTKAVQYLTKPVSKVKLFNALDSFYNEWAHNSQDYTIIKTHDGMQRILIRNIMYCELIGHCIHYHLADGSVISGTSIRVAFKDAVSSLIKFPCFVLNSASFIVNLAYVENINASGIKITDGRHLPVSRILKNEIINQWLDYHLKGGNL